MPPASFATTRPSFEASDLPSLKFNATTSAECLQFLQQLSYLTVAQILQLRDLLPVSAFKRIEYEGQTVYVLNTKDVTGREVFNKLKYPLKSITTQTLRRLVVSIRRPERRLFEKSDDDYGSYADEAFTLKLAYGQNGQVVIVRQSDGQIVDRLSYDGPDSIRKATIGLIKTIQELRKTLLPLPKPVHYYFRVAVDRPNVEFDGYTSIDVPQQIADGGYKCLSTMILPHGRILVDVQSTFLKAQAVNYAALTLQSNMDELDPLFRDDEFTDHGSSAFTSNLNLSARFLLDDAARRTLNETRSSRHSTSYISGDEHHGIKKTEAELMLILDKVTASRQGRSKEKDLLEILQEKKMNLSTAVPRSENTETKTSFISSSYGLSLENTLVDISSLREEISNGEDMEVPRQSPLEIGYPDLFESDVSVSNKAVANTIRKRPASPLDTISELPRPHQRVAARGQAIIERRPYKRARTNRLDTESDIEE